MQEAFHLSGYGFVRAKDELKYLLAQNRWQECGYGFDDVNDFIGSIDFSHFKTTVEERREVAELLAAANVSQRKTAKMLGVGLGTVNRALNGEETGAVPNGTSQDENANNAKEEVPASVPNGTPTIKTAKPEWFQKPIEVIETQAQAAPKVVRGTQGTGENEWYTPQEYLDLARSVMGEIDLDPASSAKANAIVKANKFFDEATNGLEQNWFGNVWLNPPYAQPAIAHFADKMVQQWQDERIDAAIMLTHNYTDTTWFQTLAHAAQAICFTRGRIKFYSPEGEVAAPTQGQAFFYFGKQVDRFCEYFAGTGFVVEVR